MKKNLIDENAGACTALPEAEKRHESETCQQGGLNLRQSDSSIILYIVSGCDDMCDAIQELVNEERVSAKAEDKTAIV